jgi:hypothetical protein
MYYVDYYIVVLLCTLYHQNIINPFLYFSVENNIFSP